MVYCCVKKVDREVGWHAVTETDRPRGKETDRQTERQDRSRKTDRKKTDRLRKTGRQSGKAGRQTDR